MVWVTPSTPSSTMTDHLTQCPGNTTEGQKHYLETALRLGAYVSLSLMSLSLPYSKYTNLFTTPNFPLLKFRTYTSTWSPASRFTNWRKLVTTDPIVRICGLIPLPGSAKLQRNNEVGLAHKSGWSKGCDEPTKSTNLVLIPRVSPILLDSLYTLN